MSMQKLIIISLFFFIFSCQNQKSTEKSEQNTGRSAIPVTVMRVQAAEITEQIRITGDIRPYYQVDIFSKVSGIIQKEYIEIGQSVRKGMVLAEVQQDIPGMEFTPVKIEATQDGMVSQDLIDEGARITPQQKLYSIQNIEKVYMVGRVLETMMSHLKIGQMISVKVDALPQENFNGKIVEISPVVDQLTRMGEVKILIQNSGRQLKPGMFARADLKINPHTGLLIPIDAIIRRGANQYIFKVEEGIAHQIKIETGTIVGNQIEVHNQLQPGDQIVVLGQNLLSDLAAVKVVEEILP